MTILRVFAILAAMIWTTRASAAEITVSVPPLIDFMHTFSAKAVFPGSTGENIKILFGNSQHLQVSQDTQAQFEIANAGFNHNVNMEYGILGPTLARNLFRTKQTTLASQSHNEYLSLPAGTDIYGLYLNLSPAEVYSSTTSIRFFVRDAAIVADGANCVCCACGDYNYDGSVNAADYVVGRRVNFSSMDYDLWRSRFGSTPSATASASAVPESATIGASVCTFLCAFVGFRRRRTEQRAQDSLM